MNIALFTDAYLPIKNGVVTSILQLKEGLEKRGHNVLIITVEVPHYTDTDNNIFRLPSIKAGLGTEQPFRLGVFHWGPVIRFLKKKNIDIIHTHSEFTLGFAGKIAARRLKVPHIHTTHTMWEEYRHYILNGKLLTTGMIRRYLKTFLKNATTIVAPSIKAKRYFRELIPDIPIKVINNGIDEDKFKSSVIKKNEIESLKKEFGIKTTDKLMIFVGRIGKEKRVIELFDSVVPVIRSNTNIKMIFVGDGPQLKELSKKAADLNMEKDFIFTGFVNWELVYRLYSIANIFVTASLSEVHPMTLIEATMCGLSIVARKDESNLDMVFNDRNGYLVESDQEMTERLTRIINDEKMLLEFSRESLLISKNFTAENHVEKMENLYNRILDLFPDMSLEID
jgi:1,2-diacylglycerol 3-alpha-glucosyltransferase